VRLDHVIVAVRDLDAATARYAVILGRPAALRSEHPRGTGNALFLFPHGPYLELLALWDAPEQGSSAAALRRRLAERGEGLHGLALSADDLDAEVARLRGRGLEIMDPVGNSARNTDGRLREWRAVRLPAVSDEDSFLIQHRGWDWRSQLLTQPPPDRAASAVTSIHHVAFDVPDAEAASAAWQQRFGFARTAVIEAERMGGRVLVHAAGAATVEFVGATRPDGPVAARIGRRGYGLSSLGLEVSDLDAAVHAARAGGMAIGDPEPGVLPQSRVARLDPASACGVAAQYLQFA
jgi:catechol 2,3-dioxygenase-like lactoylglutathione lyase family enzyme